MANETMHLFGDDFNISSEDLLSKQLLDDLYDDIPSFIPGDEGLPETNTTTCGRDYCQEPEELLDASLHFRVALGIVYIIILLVCGVGNLVLLMILSKYRQARTKTNMLIANLAASDFIVAVLCIPFDLDYYVFKEKAWTFGATWCKLVNYIRMVSLYVSTNALLVIGAERYYCIFFPQRRRIGKKGAVFMSLLVWAISVLIAVPSAMYSGTFPYHNRKKEMCGQFWTVDLEKHTKGYFVSVITLQFILPVIALSYCYLAIVWKVYTRERPGVMTEMQRNNLNKSKKKTLKLVFMLFMFIACWSPYYIYTYIRDFHGHILANSHLNTNLFYAVEAAAMGNSVINTFFNIILNKNLLNFVRPLFRMISEKYLRAVLSTSSSDNNVNSSLRGDHPIHRARGDRVVTRLASRESHPRRLNSTRQLPVGRGRPGQQPDLIVGLELLKQSSSSYGHHRNGKNCLFMETSV
ncbi:PREDICTED: prokineticin receptor 2-like [Branchiostoma belcheri]|uniref:Prokineticin receptor 2-like n=1 Tax=Branchiostoma belcheri TaxID=7741 RepID=A0A6P4YU53_BRABE|nr:PREDICTED: prokineticin receptor 2-like [Branchiostoma belcheri]